MNDGRNGYGKNQEDEDWDKMKSRNGKNEREMRHEEIDMTSEEKWKK